MKLRRRRGRHAWKGACARQPYALVLGPDSGWVRVFWFGPDDWGVQPLAVPGCGCECCRG